MEELDLKELFSIILRKKLVIFIIVLIFAILGSVYSYNYVKPMYKSTCTIILGKVTSSNNIQELDQEFLNSSEMISQSDLSLNSGLIETYSELVKSKSLIEEVCEKLNINIEVADLMKSVSVSRVNNSDLLEITVINADPKLAKDIVSEVVRIFSENVKEIYSISNVYVIDNPNIEDEPYNINHVKDIIIFIMVGIFLSFGYILLYNIIDNTVKSSYDIENGMKLKTLISIPLDKKNKEELITVKESKSIISEAFRTLRTNVQFSSINNKNSQTLLVTSCLPEEGKSYISANLAITFAQAGKKVILVDSDMRRGRQSKIFNVPNGNGLSNYISSIDSNGMEISWELGKYIKETSIGNLNLITAGNVPPNPAELLESERVDELIEGLKRYYDIIIFDGAPILPITDSLLLARKIGKTVLVAVHNKTKKDNLIKAKNSIESVGGKVIGVCLNKVTTSGSEYSDNYYYYSKPEKNNNFSERVKAKLNKIKGKINKFKTKRLEKGKDEPQQIVRSNEDIAKAKSEKMQAQERARIEEQRRIAKQVQAKKLAIMEQERAQKAAMMAQKKNKEDTILVQEKAKQDSILAEKKIQNDAALIKQRALLAEANARKEAEKKALEEAKERHLAILAEEKRKKAEALAKEKARQEAEKARREKALAEERAKEEAAMAEEKAKQEAEMAKIKEAERIIKEQEKIKKQEEIVKKREESNKKRKEKVQKLQDNFGKFKTNVLVKKDKVTEELIIKKDTFAKNLSDYKNKKAEESRIKKEEKARREAEIARIREEERLKREEERKIKEAELAKIEEEKAKQAAIEAEERARKEAVLAEEKAKKEAELARIREEERLKREEERKIQAADRAKKEAELIRIREEERLKREEERRIQAEERAKREAEIAEARENEKRLRAEQKAKAEEERARKEAELEKAREEERMKKEAEKLRLAKEKEERERLEFLKKERLKEEAKYTDEYLEENLYPKTKYNKF